MRDSEYQGIHGAGKNREPRDRSADLGSRFFLFFFRFFWLIWPSPGLLFQVPDRNIFLVLFSSHPNTVPYWVRPLEILTVEMPQTGS